MKFTFPRNTKMLSRMLLAVGIALLLIVFLLKQFEPSVYVKRFDSLKSPVPGAEMIIILANDSSLEVSAVVAMEQAISGVRRFKKLFNLDEQSSELSRFNALPAGKDLRLSPDTWYVLQEAMRYQKLSGSAFDVTVKPLQDLYEKKDKGLKTLPASREREQVRDKVGSQYLSFEPAERKLKKLLAGVEVNPEVIERGYAVDIALSILESFGAKNAFVMIGSATKSVGKHPEGIPWLEQVGLKPVNKTLAVRLKQESKKNSAVAVRSKYEKSFTWQGERYSQIIDPRSGLLLRGAPLTVAVVSSTCIQAEGLAATLVVLGREKGRELLLLFPGVRAVFLETDAEGNENIYSFPQL